MEIMLDIIAYKKYNRFLGENKMRNIILTALLGTALLITFACSKDEVAKLPEYPGWLKYSYNHFVFHYPPECYWGRNMEEFSAAYERYLKEDCEYLEIFVPDDTIHFYIYNNAEEGQKLTGRTLPFSTDNQIHWDRVSPFGLELARFLIRKMPVRMTDHKVLSDGLATLLDYSGYDYHHNAYSLVEINSFIPLDSLVNNESYNRADSLYRNWEAASLVAFITYNFGFNRFMLLWQSTASIPEGIKQFFNADMTRFEDAWLKFAMVYYEGIEANPIKLDSSAAPTELK
jgi:hypothetical protein